MVALLAVAAAIALPPSVPALAEPAGETDVRGEVTEVKGQYIKFDLSASDGVAKGQTGSLESKGEPGTAAGKVEVTAVLESYSVARVDGKAPGVGDIVVLSASPSAAKMPASLPPRAIERAIDKLVTLELKSGTKLEGIKLLSVDRQGDTGPVKVLRMEDPKQAKQAAINVITVKEIRLAGRVLSLDALDAHSETKPRRKKTLAELRAEKAAEEREKWLERLKVRGIEPWPELTEEEHKAAVEKYKKWAEEIGQAYPGMTLHETEHFLFLTNIPPNQVGPYVVNLDKMYDWMCKMYNVKQGARVFKGKALVVAFLEQQQFMDFERRFLKVPVPAGVYGICHQQENGDVLIACFRGNRTEEFAQMLVHETSHGFIHRYKTPVHFPIWVNEGMADYIGLLMVPACKSVKRAELNAIQMMRQSGSMGGDFFTRPNIDAWQYGVASNLCEFMIRSNPKAYVQFIEGMKEGLTWQESLKAAYDATPQQLVSSYGRAIGIPQLRP